MNLAVQTKTKQMITTTKSFPVLIPHLVRAGLAGSVAVDTLTFIMEDKNLIKLNRQVPQDIEELKVSIFELK